VAVVRFLTGGACDPGGMSARLVEFSVQASPRDRSSWLDLARRCEDVGARAMLVSDHPGTGPSPFVALAAASAVTSTLRLGSYVLNAGVRDALLVAGDVATLDVVSGGRAEVGIGAGHTPAEWAMTGRVRPGPFARAQRLVSVAGAVADLLAGLTVSAERVGAVADVVLTGPRAVQSRVPLLVGGGNPVLLGWGGAHADAVGISGLDRTLADGHKHAVAWSAEQVDRQVRRVTDAAVAVGIAAPALEALVQHVEITGDRDGAARAFADEAKVDVAGVVAVPYVLIGSVNQVVEQLHAARERWGISRWVVREAALDAVDAVIRALR